MTYFILGFFAGVAWGLIMGRCAYLDWKDRQRMGVDWTGRRVRRG